MMAPQIEIQGFGVEAVPRVQEFWEVLFDHHVSIGAAGLPIIARHESWPRRQKHYARKFAQYSNAVIWIASLDGEPTGYAMTFEDEVDGKRAMVLETLSVLASARGHGVGSRLMDCVDDAARQSGIALGVLDVMGGNPRARELYLRRGYTPLSETWMRSTPPPDPAEGDVGNAGGIDELAETARDLGFELTSHPGLDDTWESAAQIVELSEFTSTTWQASPIAAMIHKKADGEALALTRLEALFTALSAAGLWTIRFEIACTPNSEELRDFLQQHDFHLATERLIRTL